MRKKSIFVLVMVVVGITASTSKATTLVENFDDGLTPEYWNVFQHDAVGTPWSISVPDNEGRLAISKLADDDSSTAYQSLLGGIQSNFIVDGNFSAFIDFDIPVFPLSNRHGYNEACITAFSQTDGYNFTTLRFTTSAGHYAEGFSSLTGQPIGLILDSTVRGKLGITREGETMSAWIDHGSGPILLGSLSSNELLGPMRFQIYDAQVPSPSSDRPSTALDVRFDNFSVTADTIIPEPATLLTILSPNGGENILAETTYEITWENYPDPNIVRVKLEYSTDNGQTWTIIDPNTENDEHHEWEVPLEDANECLVRISDVDNPSINDISDVVFIIYQCIEDEPADFDDNCVVDIFDYAYFASRWLWCGNRWDPGCGIQ